MKEGWPYFFLSFFFYNFNLFIYDLTLGMYFQSSPSPSLYLEIPMT